MIHSMSHKIAEVRSSGNRTKTTTVAAYDITIRPINGTGAANFQLTAAKFVDRAVD